MDGERHVELAAPVGSVLERRCEVDEEATGVDHPEQSVGVRQRDAFVAEPILGADERRIGGPDRERAENRLEGRVTTIAIAREDRQSPLVGAGRLPRSAVATSTMSVRSVRTRSR